jgi:hypothetical protein
MNLTIILYYYDEDGEYRTARLHPDMTKGRLLKAIGVFADGQPLLETSFGIESDICDEPNIAIEIE